MAERNQKIELRRSRILQTLRREGVVSVSRLSADLGATPVTIRSDLASLEQEGYLLRVQGGAVPIREAGTGTAPTEPLTYAEEKYAIVFGNEVAGVRQDVVDASDIILEIPQYGTKHSLNVSVSVGVILWHFRLNRI